MSDEVDFTKDLEFKDRRVDVPLSEKVKSDLLTELLAKPDEKKAYFRDSISFHDSRNLSTKEDDKFIDEWKARKLNYGSHNDPTRESLEILKNPNFLDLIDAELDKRIVGEHEARKTIFMVANMRNVENLNKATDNLMINAPSGTGKDVIAEAVFDLIPEEEKEELIRTTPKVLAYTRNRKLKRSLGKYE